MAPRSTESRATIAGKWLFAAVVPLSALALGSIPAGALIVMSVLAATSCVLLWATKAEETSTAARWVTVVLALLLGVTVLQACPLPAALGRFLSPATGDIWDHALGPLQEAGPAWHPLSIAPTATRVEVLRGLFYACMFLSAIRIAMLERGGRFLTCVVMVSGTVVALSALAHTAVNADKVFGIYRPREAYAYLPGRMSPLLNTNHLAAYCGMAACVALGALLGRRAMPAPLSASMMLVLASTCVWQSSRGATGTLVFGVLLVFALTLYSKRNLESERAGVLVLAACAVGAALVVSISLSGTHEHLLSHDLTKVEIANRSRALVAAAPWFGFGRGGFETVFSSVQPGISYVTFTNPEDIVVQWLVEWGVPTTVAGFGLLGWALRPQLLLRAVRPAIGAWVAIVVGVLHDFVDYHFEVPGIVALAATCVAIVVTGRTKSRVKGTSSKPWMRRGAFGAAFATLVAIACVWPDVGHSLAEDRRSLSASAVDKTLSHERFVAEIRAAMLRYPAEPFFPLMGAVREQSVDGGSVLRWTARALGRNPRFGRAHFVLARALAQGHAAQARLEFRLAYENDENLRTAIVKEAVFIVDDETSALELVPEGPAGTELLDSLVVALGPRLPSTSVMLDEELARRAPAFIAPLQRRAAAEVGDVVAKAPWCTTSNCVAGALAAAEELARSEPTKCSSHVLVARLRLASGSPEAGLDGLEHVLPTLVDRPQCQRQLIEMAFDSGYPRRGDAALDQLVRSGCGAAADCLDLYSWAAGMEERRGHFVRAVRLLRRVVDIAPDRDDVLEHIGELGDRDGLLADALEAYGTLARRHPSEPRWPARIAELQSRRSKPAHQLP
jgi:tetratricopeptide (TPR) repeat protein